MYFEYAAIPVEGIWKFQMKLPSHWENLMDKCFISIPVVKQQPSAACIDWRTVSLKKIL